MIKSHILGFPRLGPDREYKKAVEAYWSGKISSKELGAAGAEIRRQNWQIQQQAGLDYVTVGDFAWYDHILNVSVMFNVIPDRFLSDEEPNMDTMFRMARGRAPSGEDAPACEMTKWFDTNYHYIVPELKANQEFKLGYAPMLAHIKEAQEVVVEPHKVKAVLPGPLTYLWLSKAADGKEDFDKLSLLDNLSSAYAELLGKIKEMGVEWVQLDEPILVLDLPQEWQTSFGDTYKKLSAVAPNIMIATYFGDLEDNLAIVKDLPVAGVHVDIIRAKDSEIYMKRTVEELPADKVLSIGTISGRDVWRANLPAKINQLQQFIKDMEAIGRDNANIWVGSSCSLQHTPVDLNSESKLDDELKQWLAFAKQKVREVVLIAQAVNGELDGKAQDEIDASGKAATERASSSRIHKPAVATRVSEIQPTMKERASPYEKRATAQKEHINLPIFPTTTIGSFPQTSEIRSLRGKFKKGNIDEASYVKAMQAEIASVVNKQEDIGLDVLVHGEPERNDMVEYFGELLDGVAVSSYGWVQSYGSRCVKPPIIYGDITRPQPMTVPWSAYAKEVTDKPMKAMLTGPVTILCWSFVRNDISRSAVAEQIALALRDEVADLEKAGMEIIQIDEPALREGLPLRKRDWQEYLTWAVESFRLSAAVAKDETQIHTHMCYSEFNDIMASIAAMDADVISIECSRSRMELLDVFDKFNYPNEIGPGVYDIHSPLVPEVKEMEDLMERAMQRIPAERLWVNPDCGLKTRAWPETEAALKNMVAAAVSIRSKHSTA